MIGRLTRVVIALAIIAPLAVGALLAAVTLRALPQTSGTIAVEGLDETVSVVRDRSGIAHLYASTPHDLFLAQGYVHAQDRMWQMEVWRHISSGRLSELFGRSQLDTDRFIRTLGWRRAAQRDLDALSPAARGALDAYAEGVNAWLDQHRGGLGMAFVVTGLRSGTGGLGGYDPEPWTALDSVAWQKVQAWNLGGNLDAEIFRMLADLRLGDPKRTDELFPGYSADMPIILPASATALVEGVPASSPASPPVAVDPVAALAWHDLGVLATSPQRVAGLDAGDELVGDHGIGSNNWVVAPSKSETGGALLANDPHLGIGMPSVWYMNGLHCQPVSAECPFDVAGVSFPGTPAVVLGHNARIAWGATNVDPDVEDLFVERLDPDDPDRYLYKGASRPFTVRTEEIAIAGGTSETLTVRETIHGPILNDVDERLVNAPPLALRWAATAAVDGTFEAIFRLNTAATFDDFREALRQYGTPSQNFVYADVDGHIGYQLPGRIPIRAGGARGIRPADGSDGSADWTGWIPFDQLPTAYDPPEGWIVTANNAPIDPRSSMFLGASSEWDPGYRAARILERLDELADDGGIGLDDLSAIQLDDDLPRARLVVPSLLGATPTTPDGQEVLDAISDWDFRCEVDSRGCAAYVALELRLIGAIWADELGPLARDWVGSGPSWQALVAALAHPDSPWWDRARTLARETPSQVIDDALDRVGADLRAALGDPNRWRWGRLHRASFREETLGTSGIGPLEAYFNRGPVEVGGASGAVLNEAWRPSRAYDDPYDPGFHKVGIAQVFGIAILPSYRLTIDLSDLDDARIIQTTGQSGNPFDRHYGDLIEAWRTGKTVGLPFSRSRVDSVQAGTLTLVPA